MKLIKNVHVFGPEDLGIKDVLIAGSKIIKVDGNIDIPEHLLEIIDGSGKKLIPGFIDPHIHVTGGGGEGGLHTRVPELQFSQFIKAGVTTMIGLMGTDGITRNVEGLLSKTKALNKEGLTAFMLTGSYRYPTVTLTDDVQKDIVFLQECIGGKLAISDHRSSMLTEAEIARLASDIRVAGMISGKAGILTLHMGDGKKNLQQIFSILEETDLPITTFRPTHVNRKESLLSESFDFAKMGGYIDLTCKIHNDFEPPACIKKAMAENVPLTNITISSDGGGSWSSYNEDGSLNKMGVSGVDALYETLLDLLENGFTLSDALPFMTSNTARSLKLDNKGYIKEGYDADMIMLDETWRIDTVLARGVICLDQGKVCKFGTYE